MSEPVAVSIGGFTWTAWLLIPLNALGIGGIAIAWLRTRPKMKEIEQSTEERLRTDLLTRVEKLERKIDEKEAQHTAEMAIMRHRVNNSEQCLDALLLLIEQSPDKVKDAVAMIKEMRARQRESETQEKAAFHAAKIARAGSET
jgi:hypothetical protein